MPDGAVLVALSPCRIPTPARRENSAEPHPVRFCTSLLNSSPRSSKFAYWS